MNTSTIKELKDLPQIMNEAALITIVNDLKKRVEALEESNKELRSQLNLTKIGGAAPRRTLESYIHEILDDGKIWAQAAICEELNSRYPEAQIKETSLQACLNPLAKNGKIAKIAYLTYRKKQEV